VWSPGIGFISASTILAEVGDFNDFDKAEQLAAWAGLVPTVYQSADKLITGSIIKHGSRHIRRILVEVAQAISRSNKGKMKRSSVEFRLRRDIMWPLSL
jgi:transposase